MIGSLTTKQSTYILESNHVGRLGCYADGKIVIVPITYVSDGKNIYCQSLEGKKIQMMRKNPNVCFEVSNIDTLADWRSVIAWGKYEELKKYALQAKAKKLFIERLLPLTLGETVDPSREIGKPPLEVSKMKKPIIFRIAVTDISGRYEKQVI